MFYRRQRLDGVSIPPGPQFDTVAGLVHTRDMSNHHYMAGLLDGEGSIGISYHYNRLYRSPSISVTSTTEELVNWCKQNYGGFISKKKTYQEHHKPCWVWSLTKWADIENLLTNVLPFMLEPEKIRRGRLLLEEYKAVTVRNGKYTEPQRQAKLNFEQRFLAPNTT